MKPREAARRDPDQVSSQPFSGHAAVRAGRFHRIWVLEPAEAAGPREIHRLVPAAFPAFRHRDWMGHVPVFTLKMLADCHCAPRPFLPSFLPNYGFPILFGSGRA